MSTLYTELARLEAEGGPFVLATVIEAGGSTPQKVGSKMVLCGNGALHGTVGGGAIEQQVVQAARALLESPTGRTSVVEAHLTHDLGMCCGGKMRVFLEKHGRADELTLFGGGHVGRAVGRLATEVGFFVTLVDAREEWIASSRHPGVRRLVSRDPAEVARELKGGPSAYFCIATHDHALDQAVVEALLRKPAAYLGVIGSRRKAERFKLRLRAQGFSEEEISRLRSPMGLAIRALTPEEIAVSIVGELIAVRRGATASSD